MRRARAWKARRVGRHTGHCRCEGDADHGRRWSGTGTAAKPYLLKRTSGVEGMTDSRLRVGEIFLRERLGDVGPVASRPIKRDVRMNRPEESITLIFIVDITYM